MKIRNILAVLALLILPSAVSAQEVKDTYRFKHLAVSAGIGTNGFGVEAVTPISRKFTVRAGFDVFSLGQFNVKLANTVSEMSKMLDISDKDIPNDISKKKVNIGITANIFTGHLFLDYYPWKSTGFHVTAGVYAGNNSVLHLFNTEDHSLLFLNQANAYVDDYNRTFGTNFQPVGLKFGDYVFTADENGNMDAKMQVRPVRGYLGIGWGRPINVDKGRRWNVNFDFGFMYWGEPKMRLNGDKVIKTGDSNEGGVFKFLSGFNAFPELKVSIAYLLF